MKQSQTQMTSGAYKHIKDCSTAHTLSSTRTLGKLGYSFRLLQLGAFKAF